MLYFVLGLIILILITICVSLILEARQRWRDAFDFQFPDSPVTAWHYPGSAAKKRQPDSRIIQLQSPDGRPFKALIGVKISDNMICHFGIVQSNDWGQAYFSTFLGRGGALFTFLTDRNIDLSVSDDDNVQIYVPSVTFPPHWWQRLGIFG